MNKKVLVFAGLATALAGAIFLLTKNNNALAKFLLPTIWTGGKVIKPTAALPAIPVDSPPGMMATRPTVFPPGTSEIVKRAVYKAEAAGTLTAQQQEALEKRYAPLYFPEGGTTIMTSTGPATVIEMGNAVDAHLALAEYYRNFPALVDASQSLDKAEAAVASAQQAEYEAKAKVEEAAARLAQNEADQALWDAYANATAAEQQAVYEASMAQGAAVIAELDAEQAANIANAGTPGASVPVEDLAALGYPV